MDFYDWISACEVHENIPTGIAEQRHLTTRIHFSNTFLVQLRSTRMFSEFRSISVAAIFSQQLNFRKQEILYKINPFCSSSSSHETNERNFLRREEKASFPNVSPLWKQTRSLTTTTTLTRTILRSRSRRIFATITRVVSNSFLTRNFEFSFLFSFFSFFAKLNERRGIEYPFSSGREFLCPYVLFLPSESCSPISLLDTSTQEFLCNCLQKTLHQWIWRFTC